MISRIQDDDGDEFVLAERIQNLGRGVSHLDYIFLYGFDYNLGSVRPPSTMSTLPVA